MMTTRGNSNKHAMMWNDEPKFLYKRIERSMKSDYRKRKRRSVGHPTCVMILASTSVWLACTSWDQADAFVPWQGLYSPDLGTRMQPISRITSQTTLSAAPLSTDSISTASSAAAASNTSSTRRELYPPWSTEQGRYENGTLLVDDEDSNSSVRHKLFYQVYYGNLPSSAELSSTTTTTALFLHGGPGAACFPNHARFFDPQRYDKIVLLDQRGCGHSTVESKCRDSQDYQASPSKIHHQNTLPLLIEDIQALRQHLDINQWTTILGGSWGSTLALGYAQEYPSRVHSLILRGVCTMRQSEVDWLFSANENSASKLFPHAWKEFESAVDMVGTGAANAVGDTPDTRSALTGYHIVFLADSNGNHHPHSLQEAEAKKLEEVIRSWRKWEFLMSMAHKLPSQANNLNMSDQSAMMNVLKEWETAHAESPVIVARKRDTVDDDKNSNNLDGRAWSIEDAQGALIETSRAPESQPVDSVPNAEEFAQTLRQSIGAGVVQPLPHLSLPSAETFLVRSDKIPAQVLLTCHYSYYRGTCIPYNLLDANRMQQLRDVKCIAVQGGRDGICPPDTALDLCQAYPGDFELRMPVHAGHSMYDPFLTNELVKATDQIVDDLNANCPSL